MLFGVEINHPEAYTDFMLITASSEEVATDMLNEMGYADFEIVNAEELVMYQYDGLATLATIG